MGLFVISRFYTTPELKCHIVYDIMRTINMLRIKDLTIETEVGKKIVENLNLHLNKGDKLAVIGEEGNGKSTLLKTIYNKKDVEDYCKIYGEIHKKGLTIGYLEQSLDSNWSNQKVGTYFLKEKPDSDIDYTKFEDINRILKKLSKIGIDPSILDSEQLIKDLSGGEKVKIQIAKILTKDPDILLLDEPTNDLDIPTLEWLEDFILTQKTPIIFVSHDETLLEKTANRILHLEHLKGSNTSRHTIANVGYEEYVTNREKALEKQEQMYNMEKREYLKDKQILSRQKSIIRTKQITIDDSSTRRILNKQMRNILVRERKTEEKRKTERVQVEDPIYMEFDKRAVVPKGRVVLNLNIKELKIGKKVLAKDIKLFVKGPEKIAIIGQNGTGKTTLLKEILHALDKKEGLKVGYMPQNYNEVLDDDMKVFDYITKELEDLDEDLMRAYIGSIKLTWEEMSGFVKDLSLGQKAKVILLKMMLEGNNVLVLDEPTRNMSSLSNPVIRKMLRDFKGSIISVSHDRKFLKEVCDKVYRLSSTGLKEVRESLF
ncbi:MAG TPA: ATP-binding cassette domain-containing protein [Candidatus Dojkabacteria bacterium]|nr:ATP-binding cassette domain-containing protein [Candidatus Dojkabacteria bacterium]